MLLLSTRFSIYGSKYSNTNLDVFQYIHTIKTIKKSYIAEFKVMTKKGFENLITLRIVKINKPK